MRTPLFLDQKLHMSFEKIAMATKLSDAPEAWQREIASEVYKQVPYISQYAVNVVLERVDAERGFAFGGVHVTNKSDSPLQDQAALPQITIPVSVQDRMLAPLDLFMDGEAVFPLTEERLRERLFRTDTFETSTRKPSDRGIVDQLYPPMRTNYGMGTAMGDSMGMGKSAMDAEAGRQAMVRQQKAQAAANPEMNGTVKGASLIEAIAPTVSDLDVDSFVEHVSTDPALANAAAHNPAFAKLAMALVATPRTSVEKTASALVSAIRPTVVQLEKLASGNFLVKWANAGAFAPQQMEASGQQASEMAGADLSEMNHGGTVTVGTEKAQQASLLEEGYKPIEEFGTYEAFNVDTNMPVAGTALEMIDFEMHPLDMLAFVSQEIYAVQDEILGKRQSDAGPNYDPLPGRVPAAQAQGSGMFVFRVTAKYKALPPMDIQGTSQSPDGGFQIQGETLLEGPVVLTITQGLQEIQQLGEGHFAVPDFLEWLPIQQQPAHLAKEPAEVEAVGNARNAPTAVDLKSTGGGEFSMSGPPVEKLARDQVQFLKTAQTEFLLVAMGMDPFEARDAMKLAQRDGIAKLAGLREIVPLSHVHHEMTKKAAAMLEKFPYHLRRDLVKEAAALQDEDTVDKILSMGFLNPENISTFAKYLPELDKASQKLAEMLLACRLGLQEIDEGAIERAMKNLEQVISGLKSLKSQNMV